MRGITSATNNAARRFGRIPATVSYRIGLTALFGYAISYLPLAGAFWMGFAHGPDVLLFGLIGAVPSAVCSWLAAERQAPDLVLSP